MNSEYWKMIVKGKDVRCFVGYPEGLARKTTYLCPDFKLTSQEVDLCTTLAKVNFGNTKDD